MSNETDSIKHKILRRRMLLDEKRELLNHRFNDAGAADVFIKTAADTVKQMITTSYKAQVDIKKAEALKRAGKTVGGVLGALTAVGGLIVGTVNLLDKLRRIHGELRRGATYWSKTGGQVGNIVGEVRRPGRPPLPPELKKPQAPKRPVGRPKKNQ